MEPKEQTALRAGTHQRSNNPTSCEALYPKLSAARVAYDYPVGAESHACAILWEQVCQGFVLSTRDVHDTEAQTVEGVCCDCCKAHCSPWCPGYPHCRIWRYQEGQGFRSVSPELAWLSCGLQATALALATYHAVQPLVAKPTGRASTGVAEALAWSAPLALLLIGYGSFFGAVWAASAPSYDPTIPRLTFLSPGLRRWGRCLVCAAFAAAGALAVAASLRRPTGALEPSARQAANRQLSRDRADASGSAMFDYAMRMQKIAITFDPIKKCCDEPTLR